MPAQLIDITGVLHRTRHPIHDSRFLLGWLEDQTVIVGEADDGELTPGLPYRFYGRWDNHPEHGKQFKFQQFVQSEPHGRRGLVAYLTRYAPHIGPSLAGRLFDQFGGEAVKVLRTQPEAAAMGCKGLSVENAREAAVALQAIVKMEDTKIELVELFAGRGFPGALVDLCIKQWGILAPARIKRDPFGLLVEDLPGCGFARCDRLYADLGLPLDRLKRQVICLWHAIREDGGGHTWVAEGLLRDALGRAVSGGDVDRASEEEGKGVIDFERAVKVGVRAGWLAVKVEGGRRWIADGKRAANEKGLAVKIGELSQ